MHVDEQPAQGPRQAVSGRLLASQDGLTDAVGIPAEHGEPVALRQRATGSTSMAATAPEAAARVGLQVVDAGRAEGDGRRPDRRPRRRLAAAEQAAGGEKQIDAHGQAGPRVPDDLRPHHRF